jgi:hypothetical protein
MTFLRTEGHIQPIRAEDRYGRPLRPHYRVEYDLVMIIDGYNIKYEARWENDTDKRVIGRKQINIAAAFANLVSDDEDALFGFEDLNLIS